MNRRWDRGTIQSRSSSSTTLRRAPSKRSRSASFRAATASRRDRRRRRLLHRSRRRRLQHVLAESLSPGLEGARNVLPAESIATRLSSSAASGRTKSSVVFSVRRRRSGRQRTSRRAKTTTISAAATGRDDVRKNSTQALLERLFAVRARACDRGAFLRSGLWRQSKRGGLAACRLSGRSLGIHSRADERGLRRQATADPDPGRSSARPEVAARQRGVY